MRRRLLSQPDLPRFVLVDVTPTGAATRGTPTLYLPGRPGKHWTIERSPLTGYWHGPISHNGQHPRVDGQPVSSPGWQDACDRLAHRLGWDGQGPARPTAATEGGAHV